MVSFLKISENHEKLVEKVDFYSSISLSGSVSGFRKTDPDPAWQFESGSIMIRIRNTAHCTTFWFDSNSDQEVKYVILGYGTGTYLVSSSLVIPFSPQLVQRLSISVGSKSKIAT